LRMGLSAKAAKLNELASREATCTGAIAGVVPA